jgi:hypothetical protein
VDAAISIGWADPGCKIPSIAAAPQQKSSPGISIFSLHYFPSGVDFTHVTSPSFTIYGTFGGIVFAEDEVVLAVVGFGQFLKPASPRRS